MGKAQPLLPNLRKSSEYGNNSRFVYLYATNKYRLAALAAAMHWRDIFFDYTQSRLLFQII